MEKPLLNDPLLFPSDSVLQNVLGNSFSAYKYLVEIISGNGYQLVPEWRYYKDGKAWLCKACYKKKTIFWLSVWDQFCKVGFYFTEKNSNGIAELTIGEKIKEDFFTGSPIGKLIPLVIELREKEQIIDVIKLVEYKKKLK